MKARLIAFLISVTSVVFSSPFSEPYTGLTLDIPDTFQPCEDSTYVSNCPYWYSFVDPQGNILTIEIEEYNKYQSLSEHFHRTMTETDLLIEKSLSCEDLEFCNLMIGGTEFTKLKVRLLAETDKGITALFLCDYLFVYNQFGITIGLIKREISPESANEAEELMTQMLESIRFPS